MFHPPEKESTLSHILVIYFHKAAVEIEIHSHVQKLSNNPELNYHRKAKGMHCLKSISMTVDCRVVCLRIVDTSIAKVFNRKSRLKMDKKIYQFFNFDIRWWVGPSTSKNHGINFPPPLSFRKIKVFEKFFGKILSPENGHKNFDLHFLSSTASVVDFLYLIWKIWTQGFRACVFYCCDSAECWEFTNNVVLL